MLKWKPSISERAVKAVPPDLTETSPQVTSLGEAAAETRHSTNLTTVFSVQSGRLRPECVASLDPDSTWTPRDRSTAVPPCSVTAEAHSCCRFLTEERLIRNAKNEHNVAQQSPSALSIPTGLKFSHFTRLNSFCSREHFPVLNSSFKRHTRIFRSKLL